MLRSLNGMCRERIVAGNGFADKVSYFLFADTDRLIRIREQMLDLGYVSAWCFSLCPALRRPVSSMELLPVNASREQVKRAPMLESVMSAHQAVQKLLESGASAQPQSQNPLRPPVEQVLTASMENWGLWNTS